MHDAEEEVLHGGVGNAGRVVRVGRHVLRPAPSNAVTLHALFRHVRATGFSGVPEPVGVEPDGRERLVFIPGEVAMPPFPAWSQTDTALASTARLLRRYHDAVASFEAPPGTVWSEELADPSGTHEVICHNDVCPENVVFAHGDAAALLDFEFAAPGRRVWDVAAMARMCVPMDTNEDAARWGRGGLDATARLVVVADGYGLSSAQHVDLLDALETQMRDGGAFVARRVARGEQAFIAMVEQMGGLERYERRAAWFATRRRHFARALGTGTP